MKSKVRRIKDNVNVKIKSNIKSVRNVKFKKPYKDNRLILISILTSAPITSLFLAFFFCFFSPYGTGSLSSIEAFLLSAALFSLLPGLAILYFSKKGRVDIELSERESRTKFYIIAIASELIAAIVFYVFEVKLLFVTAIAYAIVTLLMMVINFKWKISAHASGLSGPLTAMYVVYGNVILPFYTLLIPVYILRHKVKAHTIWQLIGGTVLAFLVSYFVFTTMLGTEQSF